MKPDFKDDIKLSLSVLGYSFSSSSKFDTFIGLGALFGRGLKLLERVSALEIWVVAVTFVTFMGEPTFLIVAVVGVEESANWHVWILVLTGCCCGFRFEFGTKRLLRTDVC